MTTPSPEEDIRRTLARYCMLFDDQDWNGLAPAFQPNNRSSGITYDASTLQIR